MEEQTNNTTTKYNMTINSSVDSSRPFRSVKEAVAIFGERILAGEVYNQTPSFSSPRRQEPTSTYTSTFSSPTISFTIKDNKEHGRDQINEGFLLTLNKLEAELEATKAELEALKQRESETEIAVASLNAERHKNMSKLALAEATAAKNAAATTRASYLEREMTERVMEKESTSPTLSEILGVGKKKECFREKQMKVAVAKKKKQKQKPIVPLVGDLLFKKKSESVNDNFLIGEF